MSEPLHSLLSWLRQPLAQLHTKTTSWTERALTPDFCLTWNCLLDEKVMGNMRPPWQELSPGTLEKVLNFFHFLLQSERFPASGLWKFCQLGKRTFHVILARLAWANRDLDTIQQQPETATWQQHNWPSWEQKEARRSSLAQLHRPELQRTTKDQSIPKQVPRSKRITDPFPHISPCSNSSRPEHYIYATRDDKIQYVHLNTAISHFKNVALKDHHLKDVKLNTKSK